jgi:hypothetical protein
MLVKLPNGVCVNPLCVQSVVAGQDVVSVMLSTWNNFGNFFEVLTPAEGQTAEEMRDEIVTLVNESC